MSSPGPLNAKRLAAARALDFIEPGMRLGLGTGSTAAEFVALLGQRVADGLRVVGIPTSERTAAQARAVGIPLATLEDQPELDLTVDGADEFDSRLRLIKGGGGALLREKIIAMASHRMIVIADESKAVAVLGRFPLPVEIDQFGVAVTVRQTREAAARAGCQGEIVLRESAGAPFVSDGGNFILDCHLGRIDAPEDLAARLVAIPGVVDHGLFLGIASTVISAGAGGITVLGRPGS
ncbi:MAG: ribose-5-phosphate isomerase RpiA [Beijerinckiaceae bacterium]|nr:ribose-5-phosphate isomerase RpiA [Beijerinckiaceae bacterium]